MSLERLYLFSLHYTRDIERPNNGYHSGLVFAVSEREAERKAGLIGAQRYEAKDDWQLREVKIEEVGRPILERAATEVLGWPKPESSS